MTAVFVRREDDTLQGKRPCEYIRETSFAATSQGMSGLSGAIESYKKGIGTDSPAECP